ncbi:hypothetical protein HDR58_08430 [bacterium]|nr:hypothetical protein [bacterium]
MGMAASQARLLTITARLADNELRSQTINNAKMRLATQSSQASDNYIKALNEANLMFNNYDLTGNEQSQLLTYNALTSYSPYNNQYGIVNSAGQLLVSEAEAGMFEAANGNLNAYLKAHGLEFNTTYFNELGNYVSVGYPSPFDNIAPDKLQEMYEAYGSYENSVEIANYNVYYEDFISKSKALSDAVHEKLPAYLLYEGNSPKLEQAGVDNITMNLTGDNVKALLLNFENAFGVIEQKDDKGELIAIVPNSENTYNIGVLRNNDYLTEAGYNEMVAALKSLTNYKYQETLSDGSVVNRDGVKYVDHELTEKNGGFSVSKAEDDSDIYIIGGNNDNENVKITTSGGVYTVVLPDAENNQDNFASTGATFNSLEEAIKSLSSAVVNTDENGAVVSSTTYNYNPVFKDGKLESIESYYVFKQDETDNLKALLIDMAKVFFDFISSTDSVVNIENMSKDLLAGKLIGVNNTNLANGDSIETIIENYNKAKENYLSFITTNSAPLEEMLSNGKISVGDLKDVDTVLKLANANSDIKFTTNYQTVISELVVENMIENYGEPKYAWVDENDKNNTGNADSKAQWYTNLFNRMRQGYKQIENGLAASSEWIEFAFESGLVSMEQVDKAYNWKSLDYKTCTKITEQTDNSAAIAKAEAEYTRAMNDIDAKDSLYDMELKNIDTEHTALQTEYDTIKGVISKNIDRTFKFNQNG